MMAKAVGILRGIPLLKKYGSMSLREYASRFRDPLIRHAFTYLFVYPEFAYTQLCFFLAGLHIEATAYPQGSSLALARAIENTFLGLQGNIEDRKTVKRIVVKGGRATGVELEGRFLTPNLCERYATQPLYHSFIQVSLG